MDNNITNNVFFVFTDFVRLTQCHTRALVLTYLVNYDDWVNKSYADFGAQLILKEKIIRKILKEFCEQGWCESKNDSINGISTMAYRALIENIIKDIKIIK